MQGALIAMQGALIAMQGALIAMQGALIAMQGALIANQLRQQQMHRVRAVLTIEAALIFYSSTKRIRPG
jgi:predicted membrane-bound mannosyltransferase